MDILPATTPAQLAAVRALFREYERFLGLDLCFQGFEDELAGLPGKYAPPEGALLLAAEGADVCGCVGLRKIAPGVCEMKRLFVRPGHRGRRLGSALAGAVIAEAKARGFAVMRLDTLAQLTQAIRLYERLGFYKIAPYCQNPLAGVSYWELQLQGD